MLSSLADMENFVDQITLPAFLLSVDEANEIRLQRLNQAHFEANGIPTEAIKGKTPAEVFPQRVAETILANYTTCLRENRSHRYEELLKLHHKEYWWDTTLSPLRNDEGRVIGIVGIAIDITEAKTRELNAAKAHEQLQKLNENIALFTSMTAHDVRGPLTKISMLTEATLEGFSDMGDDKLEMIEMTQEIAEKALGYVEDILGYARALKQHEELPVPVDLLHLSNDIAALVDPEARLTIAKPALWVQCEVIVLQMILRNLAENAVRYAHSKVAITVEAEQAGTLTFTVADDGDGFEGGEASFAKRIALAKKNSGTRGFGLSAVAHVIQTRGGRLWLGKPDVDLRTRVRFTLPGQIIAEPSEQAETTGISVPADQQPNKIAS